MGRESPEELFCSLLGELTGRELSTHRLSIRTVQQYGRQNGAVDGGFEEVALFSLDPDAESLLDDFAHNYFDVSDSDGHTVGVVPGHHIYQNFLPDQIHSFEGHPFRIGTVDADLHRINVEHQSACASSIYRQVKTVRLTAGSEEIQGNRFTTGRHTVETRLFHGSFSIQTTGYYAFQKGIDFSEGAYTFVPLKDSGGKSVPIREYRKGRVLSIRISLAGTDSRFEDFGSIAFTLALLINEALPSLFPETWPYAFAVTPKRPETDERFTDFVPGLTIADRQEEDGAEDVSLYIFEDSLPDMGLINAVYLHLKYVFEVVEDYLAWLLESDNRDKSYLAFGTGRVSESLRLEETRDLLADLLAPQADTLRKKRKQFIQAGADTEQATRTRGRECDFCGEALSEAAYETLPDGRERCQQCKNTAVDTLDALKGIYAEAKNFVSDRFGIRIREDIQVQFTMAGTLQEVLGRRFIPTSSMDHRVIGIAVLEGDRSTIYVENGQPYHMTLGAIAHELTHIWQFDNLDHQRMQLEYGRLLTEGHAMWVEIHCLAQKGIGRNYREREASREDDYGKGYRMIKKTVEDSGNLSPFEILLGQYPKA